MRILVVDDDETNRRGARALLELAEGVDEILEASNGLEAVETVAREVPDLVFMDVRMPVMNGIDATRQIKERWPHVIVFVCTMYADVREEAQAAGADQFQLKGNCADSLMRIVRSMSSRIEDK